MTTARRSLAAAPAMQLAVAACTPVIANDGARAECETEARRSFEPRSAGIVGAGIGAVIGCAGASRSMDADTYVAGCLRRRGREP